MIGRVLFMFKRSLIPLIMILILNLFNCLLAQATTKVQFTIIYTNDVMGEVEPCG